MFTTLIKEKNHMLRKTTSTITIVSMAAFFISGCSNESPISIQKEKSIITSIPPTQGYLLNIYCPADRGLPNKFLCAETAGQDPLIANRSAVGLWEQFIYISNGDGSISFQSLANLKFVTATSAEVPLIASSTSIGTNEKFLLETIGTEYYKIKSLMNNKRVNRAWDSKLYPAAGPYSSSSYYIYTNKIKGFSANTNSGNAYIWDGIYLVYDGNSEHGIPFYIKTSSAPSGATASIYIDNNFKGSVSISASSESLLNVYDFPPQGIGSHNFKIQFNASCVLDYFRWDYYPGTIQ
jgi:hypothetical protein